MPFPYNRYEIRNRNALKNLFIAEQESGIENEAVTERTE
jgi:hypothetical protein